MPTAYNPYALQQTAMQSPLYGGYQQGNPYGGYTVQPGQTQFLGDPNGIYAAQASVMNNQNTNQTQYNIAEGNANAEMARLMQQLLFNQGQTIYTTGFQDQWNQRQNDTQRYLADQNLAGQLGVANTNMQGQLGVAGINSQTALGTAGINAQAQNYATDAQRQTALGGQQNAYNIANLQNQGAIQQANIAANASTVPAYLRQDRFNSVLPLLQGLFYGPDGAPQPAPAPGGTTQGSPGMVNSMQSPPMDQRQSLGQMMPSNQAPTGNIHDDNQGYQAAMNRVNSYRASDPNVWNSRANIAARQTQAQSWQTPERRAQGFTPRPSPPIPAAPQSPGRSFANTGASSVPQNNRLASSVPQGQYAGVGMTGRPNQPGNPTPAQPSQSAGSPNPGATTQPILVQSPTQPTKGGGTQPVPSQPYITPQNELNHGYRISSGPDRSQLIDPVPGQGASPSASPFSNRDSAALSSASAPAAGSSLQDRLNAQNRAAAEANGQTWVDPPAPAPVADAAPTPAPTAAPAAASPTADTPPATGGGGLIGGGILGLLGGSASTSGGTAGGTQPTIPYAPPSSPQQWQQQVNQEIGRNAASMASQNQDATRSMAARYGANSPALQSILNQNNARLMGLNQQARVGIPMQGQQAFSNYSLNYGQALENQYANRQREALQRQQVSVGSIAPLLNAIAGFAG